MADQKITELNAVVTPDDADILPTVTDLATTPTTKKITWTVIKAFLKTYFDTLYRAIAYINYAADAGSTDAYAITVTPDIDEYTIGQEFTFKANTANTGACTLAVNGLAAIPIRKNVTEDLATGDILANQIVVVKYDGTQMQLVSNSSLTAVSTSAGAADANKVPRLNASGVLDSTFTTSPIVRTYLNAGSPATWTKPAGLKYVIVEVQAGGGNGENDPAGDPAGGGGGGGGYARKLIAAASLGTTETVTTGAAGGASSFGSHCSATAGANGSSSTGGAGGIGSGGDINLKGQSGFNQDVNGTSGASPGNGGSSHLGGGGVANNTSGGAGGVYGGGGGAHNGAGAAGIVIVTEYYN